MISTKGRYAIRILLDLAEHDNGEFVPLKDIAKRQNISLKYIERILPTIKEAGLLDSMHGKGGGYRLSRQVEEYNLWEILSLTEGNLAPVSCLKTNAKPCDRVAECKTLSVWKKYYQLTKEYFASISLSDLLKQETSDNYVI